ncbi:efflux RND transporter periplasmic adaptor subunit [Pleurocapsa sp. PCC 7319]|uniref:efflux RND transporter periplasmic adaptor subunit n=1 Tax=Pleurocapsa sp. PCC 7319 TaxID=118161 RepID=UPI00034DDCA5|nr:efflux RND transporter periplasmic adaptor subunit [Pleurocapsa sp. PCC 7319]
MFLFNFNRWLNFVSKCGVILSFLVLTTACNANSQTQLQDVDAEAQTQVQRPKQVVALGKLIPRGEVIKLSVTNAEDSRVNQILVEEGDRVEKNQVIAILQGFENRERDLEEAEKNVELAKAKLEQTRAGETKQAELAAQKANISRLESQLRNETQEKQAAIASATAQLRQAQITFERNQTLRDQGAVSQQTLDQVREQLETAQANLNERKAQLNNTEQTLKEEINQERENLAKLEEIRPVDVRVAEIELERAIIAVKQRRADLEDTKVKVPIAGQILRINTRVGEQVNTQRGIVELGRTHEMYAIAEVYETDISKVRIGQPATISSEYGGFAGNLKGTVEHLGLQVGAKQLSEASEDPTQDENSRIVEVKIRINPEDSKKVTNLTNMRVRVEIDN